MALMARVVTGTVAAALVVAGGYAWADIHDFVPGILTIGPEPAPAGPVPDSPGRHPRRGADERRQHARPRRAVARRPRSCRQPSTPSLADPASGRRSASWSSDALTGEVLALVDTGHPTGPGVDPEALHRRRRAEHPRPRRRPRPRR